MAAFVAGDIVPDPGKTVRFHVVRQTPYGDRYKLFALQTPEPSPVQFMGPYGMALLQASDGRIVVDAVSFMHEQSETLAELDLDLRATTEAAGLGFHRVPIPNDDPDFAIVLADLVALGLGDTIEGIANPEVGHGCACRPGAAVCLNG